MSAWFLDSELSTCLCWQVFHFVLKTTILIYVVFSHVRIKLNKSPGVSIVCSLPLCDEVALCQRSFTFHENCSVSYYENFYEILFNRIYWLVRKFNAMKIWCHTVPSKKADIWAWCMRLIIMYIMVTNLRPASWHFKSMISFSLSLILCFKLSFSVFNLSIFVFNSSISVFCAAAFSSCFIA